MKKTLFICLTVITMVLSPLFLQAQNPPHPNGGNNPGGNNTPVGGSAPINGGITLLLVMGTGYGMRKIYRQRKLLNL
jgi:hypothetical protein